MSDSVNFPASTGDGQAVIVEDIPFREIPHQSALYLGYLDSSPAVLSMFRHPGPTLNTLERMVRDKGVPSIKRKAIVSILKQQNEKFGCGECTRKNIEDLIQADAVAVLTGQQVGLFTGPLYTIYKTMTAIRLAAELRARRIKAIPIFWMESEDHDLAEATHISVIGPDQSGGNLLDQLFPQAGESARPVGSIQFPDSIKKIVNNYVDSTTGLNWSDEIRSQLLSAYRPGATFSESFAAIMVQLFGSYGLVLFDPQDPAAKALAAPVFSKAIQSVDVINASLRERDRELESSGFHTQVSMADDSTVLFYRENHDRRLLTKVQDGFAVKGTGTRFSADELLRLSEKAPERFSPNVLLRPIVQDSLFPTVAYVGGPSEVAYFAQVEALYRIFGRPMPMVWPRASFTLVGPEVVSIMGRRRLSLLDILQGKKHLLQKLVPASDATKTLTVLRDRLESGFAAIQPDIATIDASLEAAMENARRKITHNLEGLEARIAALDASRNTSTIQEAQLLLDNCLPALTPQEREIGVHPFMARYGPSMIDSLYSLIPLEKFVHRVVLLSQNGAHKTTLSNR